MNLESSPDPVASLGRPRKQHGKRTLARLLRERGAFSTAHAVDVALDICDALAPAHANGVVHGQLGLDCVRLVFAPEGGPSDLEIFTLATEDDSGVAGSHQGLPFLGPDRRAIDRAIDARADVWALGALLYTMLVGTPPPAKATALPPDGVPLSLAVVVEACLAADPANRPQTVDEIAEKLASFASSPPTRFVRLAERRERRENAERVRRRLELRGLAEMPGVLDKLDDAALARAQRETTTISSVVIGPTTEAAMQRLMTAVHEGTDAARVELASGLPALVDFDDEDDDVLPTRVAAESLAELPPAAPLAFAAHELVPVACPLSTAPNVPIELSLPPQSYGPAAVVELAPPLQATPPRRGRGNAVAAIALAALAISLTAGYVGYTLSARASASAAVAPAPVAQTTAAEPAPSPPAPPPIPVFAASALPDVAPVTPASLQEAKR